MVILFDQFNLSDDIFEVIFTTEQQIVVAKLLIDYIKSNNREIDKTKMSLFATKLHDGTLLEDPRFKQFHVKDKAKLSYNKRQFYDRILTPMKSMGLINYDLYKKTYRLSKNFQGSLLKIGQMWLDEYEKPANIAKS